MTQSGQGEEPSARPAREGIVLPSDGGEPLLPGMTGGPVPHPAAPAAQPPAGQSWGGPWGPEQQHPQQQHPQQQHFQQPQPQQPSQQDRPWPQAPAQEWPPPEQPAAWAHQAPDTAGVGPLPPEGAPAPSYGGQAPHHQGYGEGYGSAGQGAPVPHAAEGATQYLPPVAPGSAPADEGATQYLPPVVPGSAPVPVDEGATQYIPPVAQGALPPETGAEETRYLGRAARPQPAAPHPDAEATQYIPPYTGAPGGDRQPPAEFDNLFRGDAGGDGPAGATQQMPRIQEPQPAYTPQGPGGGRRGTGGGGDEGGRGGRSRSKVPLIAAVGVGIAVLGIGAGALLGGGGGGGGNDDGKTVAASAPATGGSSSAAGDPARGQAVALDKLLADSGDSRASVINAVGDVRACKNLDEAASDLRDAAKQRTGLVTRLSKLSVDQLPGNAELTSALTKAWQASASADNHYAAWADQVSGRKGCKRGQARGTGETLAGNRDSTTASAQKVKAAGLWNAIAKKYGLTQRQPTQL
ncbi:hypothetical protein ABZX30_01800 [Streptomyces sp. NPDC004542]|uniref:hypothetical protein n=1 Tax=Streptomyces sp. NPDC004542 TaxID=3154281 RepID=UPI0033BD0827